MENRQIWLNDIEPVEALSFEKIESRYIKVIMARLVIIYFILMGCALFILMLDTPYDTALLVATECLLAAAFAVNAALVRKIYDFKGFALRNKDISYRSGIFFRVGYYDPVQQDPAGQHPHEPCQPILQPILCQCYKRVAGRHEPPDHPRIVGRESRAA